jgi:type I restriction enzyme S subunit
LLEQHRIVAQLDELMAVCDELDAARAKREQSRDLLAVQRLSFASSRRSDQDVVRKKRPSSAVTSSGRSSARK